MKMKMKIRKNKKKTKSTIFNSNILSLKSLQPNIIINNLLISLTSSPRLPSKTKGFYKIQSSIHFFILCLLEFMCSVHLIFYISIFETITSNTFSKQYNLLFVSITIESKVEYKILQIVNPKFITNELASFFTIKNFMKITRELNKKFLILNMIQSLDIICSSFFYYAPNL